MDPHDTFESQFRCFGLAGTAFYLIPSLWIMGVSFKGSLTRHIQSIRPRYAIAGVLLAAFFIFGMFHNKLYSPIESAYSWLLVFLLVFDELPQIFPEKPGLNEPASRSSSRPVICLRAS